MRILRNDIGYAAVGDVDSQVALLLDVVAAEILPGLILNLIRIVLLEAAVIRALQHGAAGEHVYAVLILIHVSHLMDEQALQ